MTEAFAQWLASAGVSGPDARLAALLAEGVAETLWMTLGATFFAYVAGTPLGIVLAATCKTGLRPCAPVYRTLDAACNLLRSVPFIILLVVLIPFTRAVAGRSYGSTATIVPLVVSAAPFVARLVESSLSEVDKGVVEAAESMGAGFGRIVLRVLLPEARVSLVTGAAIALGTVLGYSAMAGAVGGGGLGDIAIQYGYYRYETRVMLLTLALLVGVAQLLQLLAMRLAHRLDRRRA